ncbi:erythromycin esterase family protein, partial [Candidatus Sumerlaeota bacterium]|nr:erythromycin esterase family protein [Candidatus Sumerlaeota bacterium]
HNDRVGDPNLRVGFYGLDLYSLYGSINAVIDYLDKVDPDEARIARDRYACFSPWKPEASSYGRAALLSSHHLCREEAIAMLRDLFAKRLDYIQRDGERFWDAIQNARLITDAERYYRVMYHGATESWNLRDQHMFETLDGLLGFRGSEAKAVVWAHNSHVGDALASEMGVRGELNIGFLARQKFGSGAYLVGFGTDHGTVAAATDWGGPMKIKDVRPAQQDSYERLCHDSGVAAFLLHFRDPLRSEVIEELLEPRLERAIGVIYRPDTERASHYFYARLPQQFDSYIWFDHTTAVCPLPVPKGQETDTHPLGLESGVSGQQPTSAECR